MASITYKFGNWERVGDLEPMHLDSTFEVEERSGGQIAVRGRTVHVPKCGNKVDLKFPDQFISWPL